MITVEEIAIALGFKVDSSSKAKAQSEASALKGTITKLLGAIGIGFTVTGLKNFIQETASYAADLKAINNQFNQTFGDVAEAAEASLEAVSQATGVAESRMKKSYTTMASFIKTAGVSASEANDYTKDAMIAIADNAAYLDKTVEETQETFQRLLKGNFQVDDNMNFNFAESERNKMAQAEYGKNYSDLEDFQKYKILLEKLQQANEQMGATHQSANEADEYTNQVAELSDVVKQLKANIGMIFLPQVLTVSTKLAKVLTKITEKLGDAEDESSLLYKITQKVTKAVDKFFDVVSDLYHISKKVINALGGFENALKLVAIAGGSVMAILAVDKITNFFDTFDAGKLKIMAVVYAIAALILLVDDFVGFMNGKESLFGHFVEGLGFDQDEVRDNVKNFGTTVGEWFDNATESVKDFAEKIGDAADGLAQFFGCADSGEALQQVLEGISKALQTIVGFVETLAGFWNKLTGADDILEGNKTVQTSNGAITMSGEDAEKYLNAQQKILDPKTQGNQAVINRAKLDMSRLEEKYADGDVKTASDTMIDNGTARFINAAADVIEQFTGSEDKTYKFSWEKLGEQISNGVKSWFSGGTGTSIENWKSQSSADATSSFKNFIYDISFGLVDLRKNSEDTNSSMLDDTEELTTTVSEAATSAQQDIDTLEQNGSDSFININSIVSDGMAAILETVSNIALPGVGNVLAGMRSASIVQNNSYNNTFSGISDSSTTKAGNKMNANAKDASSQLAAGVSFSR